jgi:hypothetical protein
MPEVNLSGPGGNAHNVIALACDVARQLGASRVARTDLADRLRKSMSYTALLDAVEAEFPGVDWTFTPDPRRPQSEDDDQA